MTMLVSLLIHQLKPNQHPLMFWGLQNLDIWLAQKSPTLIAVRPPRRNAKYTNKQ